MSETPDETKTSLPDGDYILAEGAAWLELKNFSIRVAKTDEGVVVDVFRKGAEMEESIASTYAYDSEAEESEDDEEDAAYRSERPLRIAEGIESAPEVLSHEEYMDRLREEG